MKKLLGVIAAGLTLGASVGVASAATSQVVETNHGWVSYHSEPKLSSPVVGRLRLGQKALLDSKVNRWWYGIEVNGHEVYITTNSKYTHVAKSSSAPKQSSTSTATTTHSTTSSQGELVVNHNCYLKSKPNLHPSSRMELVHKGTTVTLLGKYNRWWYHVSVNGKVGYITTDKYYVGALSGQAVPTTPKTTTKTVTKASTTSVKSATTSNDVFHVKEGNGVPVTINISGDTAKQQKLIRVALSQLGVPYWWGHQVPNFAPVNGRDGFDCSNFMAWTYKDALGVKFSGSSVYQRFHVGTPVSLNNLQPGDLLFFGNKSHPNGQGHVGMYIGNHLIVQEGGGRGKATVESLNNSRAWFGRSLVFARRVL